MTGNMPYNIEVDVGDIGQMTTVKILPLHDFSDQISAK